MAGKTRKARGLRGRGLPAFGAGSGHLLTRDFGSLVSIVVSFVSSEPSANPAANGAADPWGMLAGELAEAFRRKGRRISVSAPGGCAAKCQCGGLSFFGLRHKDLNMLRMK